MKQTQEQFVIKELQLNGFIGRNYCLNLYNNGIRPNITRLGAIIHSLNASGWEIEGNWEKKSSGKDFIYRVKSAPFKKVVYTVVDPKGGEHKQIVKYEKCATKESKESSGKFSATTSGSETSKSTTEFV